MKCPECGSEVRLTGWLSEPFEYYTEEKVLETPHNFPEVLYTITAVECSECDWEVSFEDNPVETYCLENACEEIKRRHVS